MNSITLFANQRTRKKPSICLLVKRKLKGPGSITALKGVEVSPHDVLGHYKLTLGFTKVNLAKELNVFPSEVPKFLNKPVGQTIFKGELLAFKKGMFSKSQIIAPTDGIFESLDENSGMAKFRLLPKETPLTAGVFGVVENVDHQRGEVLIKTMVTELFGIVGSGIEKEGFINVLSGAADLVNKESITQDHRGQILVAGSLILEATIRRALSFAVAGIICGGLNMDDYLAMAGTLNQVKRIGSDIGISIVATEGFGILPIGDDFYQVLQRHNGKFAIIQGNLSRLLLPSDDPDSILSCRKVSLPLTEVLGTKPELKIAEIKLGGKVRLIAPPFMGTQGEVLSIDGNPTKLESGISTYLLTVGTRRNKIKVPFSNVEIIG